MIGEDPYKLAMFDTAGLSPPLTHHSLSHGRFVLQVKRISTVSVHYHTRKRTSFSFALVLPPLRRLKT